MRNKIADLWTRFLVDLHLERMRQREWIARKIGGRP